jgi:hypothetical protein
MKAEWRASTEYSYHAGYWGLASERLEDKSPWLLWWREVLVDRFPSSKAAMDYVAGLEIEPKPPLEPSEATQGYQREWGKLGLARVFDL